MYDDRAKIFQQTRKTKGWDHCGQLLIVSHRRHKASRVDCLALGEGWMEFGWEWLRGWWRFGWDDVSVACSPTETRPWTKCRWIFVHGLVPIYSYKPVIFSHPKVYAPKLSAGTNTLNNKKHNIWPCLPSWFKAKAWPDNRVTTWSIFSASQHGLKWKLQVE